MRRMTLLMGTVGLLVAGGIGAALGCGSDAATTPKPSVSSSSSSSGSQSSSGVSSSSSSGFSSSSSSSSSSSGTAGVTNPNQITCGASLCDAGAGSGSTTYFCCARDGGTDSVCIHNSQSGSCDNSSDQNTLQLNCDEQADCPANGTDHQKCCLTRTGDVATNCQDSCAVGAITTRPQVCKTDAECSDGGAAQPTCAEKTCRGFKLHVCGTPEGCQ